MNPGVFDIIEQHKGRPVELEDSNAVVVLVGRVSWLAKRKWTGEPWEMVSSRCDMTP
jgi:hypothetical protein